MTNYYFKLIFLVAVVLFVNVQANVCKQKGPCSCLYDTGFGYDLGSLGSTTNFIATDRLANNLTYFFHPCRDLTIIPDHPDAQSNCRGNSVSATQHFNHTRRNPNYVTSFYSYVPTMQQTILSTRWEKQRIRHSRSIQSQVFSLYLTRKGELSCNSLCTSKLNEF